VSTDRGASWSDPAPLLSLSGTALSDVSSLAFSPTFAVDRTLLGVALGWTDQIACHDRTVVPVDYRGAVPYERAVVIRSTDGGASWKAVHDLGTACVILTETQLSSDFAHDGISLILRGAGSESPASGTCEAVRTGDSGDSWRLVHGPGGYEAGCSHLTLA